MPIKDTFFSKNRSLNCRGKLIDLSSPKVMGILNVTPDSFYDGGRYVTIGKIMDHVQKMVDEGADIIDVGGYSSRPGASEITINEELDRIIPVLEKIRKKYPAIIVSVDTFRSEVALQAVKSYDVDIINDVSAGEMDDKMFETIAGLNVPYIMMHMRGTPQIMQELTDYNDILKEITVYFSNKLEKLRKLGIHDVVIDPGFGFGKNLDQNYFLLKNLDVFQLFEVPLMVGISRKSMIYKALGITPQQSLNGTTVLNTIAIQKGANILRVHDVKEAIEAIKLVNKLYESTE